MLIWTIQAAVISITFIFLIHHLFGFLKSTLTVPKIKDLVNSPTQKYEDMFSILNSGRPSFLPADNILPSVSLSNDNPYDVSSSPSLAAATSSNSMKNELKNFLKRQLQPSGAQDISVSSESFAFSGASSSSIGSTPIDLNSF